MTRADVDEGGPADCIRHRGEPAERARRRSDDGHCEMVQQRQGLRFLSRDGGDDVFVHYSAIQGEGYRNLEEVEFDIGVGRKGDEAQNVRAL